MLFDLRRLSEMQRRLVALSAGLLLIAGTIWLMVQVVEDVEQGARGVLWRRFIVAALVTAGATSAFVWRKLADPTPADRHFDGKRYFWLFVGLGAVFRRQLVDSPEAMSLVAGASIGYFAGTMFVYVYDLLTNKLAKGRSWHYPDDPGQRLYPSSNTSSPT